MNVQSRDGRYRITYGEQVLVMMLTLRLVFGIWEESPCRLNIILDEASRVLHRELGGVSPAVFILEEGRKFGLRSILADQVLSVLHKSVQQAPLLIFFRTKSSDDLLYLERVLGREVVGVVEGLDTGEAIMFKAGRIARTEFKRIALSEYRAVIEVSEEVYDIERKVYEAPIETDKALLDKLVKVVKRVIEDLMEKYEIFEPDRTPREVAELILRAVRSGIDDRTLEDAEERTRNYELLKELELVKPRGKKKIVLTWKGLVFLEALREVPGLKVLGHARRLKPT